MLLKRAALSSNTDSNEDEEITEMWVSSSQITAKPPPKKRMKASSWGRFMPKLRADPHTCSTAVHDAVAKELKLKSTMNGNDKNFSAGDLDESIHAAFHLHPLIAQRLSRTDPEHCLAFLGHVRDKAVDWVEDNAPIPKETGPAMCTHGLGHGRPCWAVAPGSGHSKLIQDPCMYLVQIPIIFKAGRQP